MGGGGIEFKPSATLLGQSLPYTYYWLNGWGTATLRAAQFHEGIQTLRLSRVKCLGRKLTIASSKNGSRNEEVQCALCRLTSVLKESFVPRRFVCWGSTRTHQVPAAVENNRLQHVPGLPIRQC